MRIIIDKDIITNGDMVKAMFEITTLKEDDDFITFTIDGATGFTLEKKWWNAVYKRDIREDE